MTTGNPFTLARTPKIVFGAGAIRNIGGLAAPFGHHLLVVQSRSIAHNQETVGRIILSLENANIRFLQVTVSGEPSPDLVDAVVRDHAGGKFDAVIAVGGGSAIDAGKAISAMLPLGGSVTVYLEEIGTKQHPGCKVPFVAVPTTAGTGSEASANSVLSRTGPGGYKKSLRHENLVPDIALVDPDLTLSCPPSITAACGMDALTQLIEAYVSPRATPFTDALIERALPGVPVFLARAFENGADDTEARAGMAWAALVSGIALANAGLGVVHGMASPLGAFFPVPHGVICGTLLLPSIRITIRELERSIPTHPALKKYSAAGRLLSPGAKSSTAAGCAALISSLESLVERLQIPRLSAFGIAENDVAGIVEAAGNRNHPVQLSKELMTEMVMSRL
ncbi:MAG: iron-containing alcohol dehydrogenase [Chitinispirillaceae bacterium]|nr:iron-containing alcohol dehydrogenase [Chitinispirillaceae bacterium]